MIEIEKDIDQLEGIVLEGGWSVTKFVNRKPYQSGGCHSAGYVVENDKGESAFLKVLDFSQAFADEDPTKRLEEMLQAYNFERDVLGICNDRKLDKIVVAKGHGTIKSKRAAFNHVYYLIFELAECDARVQMAENTRVETSWCVGMLHHIAVGLQQLHTNSIYHQDLKPSNVLLFNNKEVSKLADLGRAHSREVRSPFDKRKIPGALSYAPPEQLYGLTVDDEPVRRGAADMYHFASMIFFVFTGVSLTTHMLIKLRDEHKPPFGGSGWRGFFADVVPYLRTAFDESLEDLRLRLLELLPHPQHKSIVNELCLIVRYTGDPEIEKRGHPRVRHFKHWDRFSFEQFISQLARIRKQLEVQLVRHAV
jgi:eukaryotic-like serine/threonine-protein kinase